ncbi:MAG TPA: DUF2905 domain-containing protein [Terracidiphilus sp.]|nr:DUF2905 domain-containing protein [Terracidiphilus sp.]
MAELGKALLGLGVLLVLAGAGLMLAARWGWPLGRLPGDFAWKSGNARVYFPLGTSILISIVLTVVLYLITRFRR